MSSRIGCGNSLYNGCLNVWEKLGNKGLLAQGYILLKCDVIDGTLIVGCESI